MAIVFCRLQKLKGGGDFVAVNPAHVRYVRPHGSGVASIIEFDNDHQIEVMGDVPEIVRGLSQAESELRADWASDGKAPPDIIVGAAQV
ncbi:MAG: hypothetical protein ACHQAY_03515 [Hyphomicrobiales bacterium]